MNSFRRFLLLSVLLAAALAAPEKKKKCHALVLQGGGDRGSYQAGVIAGMINSHPDEVQWDILTGVSVGSINSIYVVTTPIGEEKQLAKDIIDLWGVLKKDLVFRKWPGGLLYSVVDRESLYDNTPLREFLQNFYEGRQYHRKFDIAAVNLNDGMFEVFNETTIPAEEIWKGTIASASIPVFFPPMLYNDMVLVDGGTAWNVDLPSAINRCFEVVDDPADIIVDVILCNGRNISDYELNNDEDLKTFQVYTRVNDINDYYSFMTNIARQVEEVPEVTLRSVIYPSDGLSKSLIPIDFDPDQIADLLELGQKDGREQFGNYVQVEETVAYALYIKAMRTARKRVAGFDEFMRTEFENYKRPAAKGRVK